MDGEIKQNQENNNLKESMSMNNDKTFNKLKELQILIKKESALKELCKKILIKFKI